MNIFGGVGFCLPQLLILGHIKLKHTCCLEHPYKSSKILKKIGRI